ncbi:MAG TPA: porin [Candidatus Cryptobacteroides merdipullorum]|uniref:Porin n=1 Tax=Candidatus Cryptobacteroides merdipullorum TaxID=2840771 RepID=A0A9D1GMZ3_9BACT|nr:porin [Candidatus Cryptobacteroides merdipullorum]
MKKLLLMTAVCCLGLAAASAQETDVNQYGQVVNVTPLNAEMQDGILVIKSKDSAYKVWFDIRVQGDAAVYFGQNKDYDPIGNGMSLRRTRFAVKAQLDENWYGEFDTDWTSGLPEIKDAYIAFNGVPGLEIQAGNFKENFSIQRNNTSRYLQFMERPMVTALAPSRHLGLNVTWSQPLYWLSGGVFGPELKSSEEQTYMEDNNKDYGRSEGLSYTLKGVLRPMYKSKNGALHIGAAFSYRNPKTTNTDGYAVARYSSRNSTNINRKKYLDTDDMPGMDHEIAWTVELAGHWKGLRYETAYLARTAYFDPTVNDIVPQKADGWYAQAGILLFGGRQNYDADGAKYTRVTRGRSWGDLELCARYEYCNFNTANYFGGSAEAYTLGLNWYATNNVKIVLNYQFNNNDRYANGKGKLLVGHDAAGNPTSDYTKVVESDGKAGVDYHMIALRFEVAF